jgi:hypothetical protein
VSEDSAGRAQSSITPEGRSVRFKIDTVTKRTWAYSVVYEKDKFVEEWVELTGKQ